MYDLQEYDYNGHCLLLCINTSLPLMHKYSHYKVIIVAGSNTTTNTKTDILDNTLLPVSQSQTSYYVAAAIRVENFQSTFIIGDGHTYTLDNETFMNVPLNNDQEYTVFIRLYSDVDVSYYNIVHTV